jgi:hypothetical protein
MLMCVVVRAIRLTAVATLQLQQRALRDSGIMYFRVQVLTDNRSSGHVCHSQWPTAAYFRF